MSGQSTKWIVRFSLISINHNADVLISIEEMRMSGKHDIIVIDDLRRNLRKRKGCTDAFKSCIEDLFADVVVLEIVDFGGVLLADVELLELVEL